MQQNNPCLGPWPSVSMPFPSDSWLSTLAVAAAEGHFLPQACPSLRAVPEELHPVEELRRLQALRYPPVQRKICDHGKCYL